MTFVNASVPLNSAADALPLRLRRLQPPRGEQRRLLPPRARRAQLAADLSARLPAGDRAARSSTRPAPRASAASCNKWNYDASGEYGHNSFAFTIGDTLNVSLGPTMPPNKTHVRRRHAGAEPVRRQRRREPRRSASAASPDRSTSPSAPSIAARTTRSTPGEPDSYRRRRRAESVRRARRRSARRCFPASVRRTRSTQSRNSVAGYVDVEGDVLNWLRLGVAGRAEHYSDFGNTRGRQAHRARAARPALRRARLASAPASARRRSGSRSSRRPRPTSSTSGRGWCRSSR